MAVMENAYGLQQRRDALVNANAVRVRRSEWRREVKKLGKPAGAEFALKLLMECPREIETLTVGEWLGWLPGWGQVRISRALRWTNVLATHRLGNLTGRQKSLLEQMLVAEYPLLASQPADES